MRKAMLKHNFLEEKRKVTALVSNIREDGLVLKLDEVKNGSTWIDVSGYGNHGTISGATNHPVGYSFDGQDDVITVPTAGIDHNLNLVKYITVSAFIKTSSADQQSIISRATTDATRIYACDITGGYFRFMVANGNSFAAADIITSSTIVNDGIFHHVCGTFDGNTLISYVDTVKDIKAKTTTATPKETTNYIGAYKGSQQYFSGEICQPMIYNRALSESEIMKYYNDQKKKYEIW